MRTLIFGTILFFCVLFSCASKPVMDKSVGPSEAFASIEARVFEENEIKVLPIYLIWEPNGKSEAEKLTARRRFEASAIPQQQILFFPTQFTYSEDGWDWAMEADLSKKIVSQEDLGDNLFLYEVETSGLQNDLGPGKVYKIDFSLETVLDKRKIMRQPGLFALEQGILRANRDSGIARLDSIEYNQKNRTFSANVVVFD
ncbi:hypothetical protein ACYULU_03840 [Breznakiellaceae bacterium SP9]